MQRKQRAFTLVELMIVVVIIGALAAMVLPKLAGTSTKMKIKIAKGEIHSIKTALGFYEAENGTFPTTAQGLNTLVEINRLDEYPQDPWGNPYQYRYPSDHDKDFDIWSFGPDRKEGTEDDIKSWVR